MLTTMDYIVACVFLLSMGALVYVLRRFRSSGAGQNVLVRHPKDAEAMQRHLVVVYTSAAFSGYEVPQKKKAEPEGGGRPLSKRREKLHKQLMEIADGSAAGNAAEDAAGNAAEDAAGNAAEDAAGNAAGDTAGNAADDVADNTGGNIAGDAAGTHDYPDEDDVDAAMGGMPADPAADFFSNKRWEVA